MAVREGSRRLSAPCGIIPVTALWVLCRYRHNGHWTRHPARLNREFGRNRWGDEGYAKEELVAEMGAAFLCADLDITPEVRTIMRPISHQWLTVLKGDKRAIFTAAAHAQRAADFLNELQPHASDTAPARAA